MKKERLLKMKKIFFSMALVMIFVSPVLAVAESYAGFNLTCACSVSSTKGTASTSGSVTPYYNVASIIIYKNSDVKGSDIARVKSAKATASKTYLTGGLTKAISNHYVCNSSYNPVGSAKETIVKYAYR